MKERLPRIEARELVRALKRAGFVEGRQQGSHLHLFRPADRRRVTIPVHSGKILRPGTLAGILRDIEMTPEALRDLL